MSIKLDDAALDPDAATPHRSPLASDPPVAAISGVTAGAIAALALTACGGASESPAPIPGVSPTPDPAQIPPSAPGPTPAPAPAPAPTPVVLPLTRFEAARFLGHAAFGGSAADIQRVQDIGMAGWINEQMALPRSLSRVDWLTARGYGTDGHLNKAGTVGCDGMNWQKLIGSPDGLRQRVTLALSEMFAINVKSVGYGLGYRQYSAAAFFDLLEENAFGNYRTLLDRVSTSTAMGGYLSYLGNAKGNGTRLPDENYAREVMQLFTIGLVKLKLNGDAVLISDKAQETYTQADVSQLARVFTGWRADPAASRTNPVFASLVAPMTPDETKHESGSKSFLGKVIPEGTLARPSLDAALDFLMAHENVAPFISRQLIQRLVTSNPSATYIEDVAIVFNDNGSGVKGDLAAVVRVILMHPEATSTSGLTDPAYGKVREPMVRFVQWARTFKVGSVDGIYLQIGDLSDPGTRLGQSPLRTPSVFNFFRPEYTVRLSDGTATLFAPELQITTETTVAGYLNFMRAAISGGVLAAAFNGDGDPGRGTLAGLTRDYSAVIGLVNDAPTLLDELNILLAAGQIPAVRLVPLAAALNTIAVDTSEGQYRRLYAALLFVMAAPEYLVQK